MLEHDIKVLGTRSSFFYIIRQGSFVRLILNGRSFLQVGSRIGSPGNNEIMSPVAGLVLRGIQCMESKSFCSDGAALQIRTRLNSLRFPGLAVLLSSEQRSDPRTLNSSDI